MVGNFFPHTLHQISIHNHARALSSEALGSHHAISPKDSITIHIQLQMAMSPTPGFMQSGIHYDCCFSYFPTTSVEKILSYSNWLLFFAVFTGFFFCIFSHYQSFTQDLCDHSYSRITCSQVKSGHNSHSSVQLVADPKESCS